MLTFVFNVPKVTLQINIYLNTNYVNLNIINSYKTLKIAAAEQNYS